MARSKFRLKIDVQGFNEARRSPAIQAELDGMAEQIVQATGAPEHFEAFQSPRSSRARTVVVTADEEGRRLEAEERTLTRAFSAGQR